MVTAVFGRISPRKHIVLDRTGQLIKWDPLSFCRSKDHRKGGNRITRLINADAGHIYPVEDFLHVGEGVDPNAASAHES